MTSQDPSPLEPSVRPQFKRRGRILLALLAVLVLVGLTPLATVSGKLIDINREALTTAHQQNQLLLASSIARELDLEVEAMSGQLLSVAQTLGAAVHRRGTVPREEIRQVLEEVTDGRMRYLRYSYFRAQGVQSIDAGEAPPELEPMFEAALQSTTRVQADQRSPVGSRQVLPSPAFLMETRPPRAAMLLAAPVIVGRSYRGVLSTLVDLETVWKSGAARRHGGYEIFAMDSSGTVLAGRTPDGIGPGRNMSDSPLVRRFLGGKGRTGETMPFELVVDGETRAYLGSFDHTQQGWGIFVQARRQEVYAPIRAMISSTVRWALAALGLAGFAAIFLARTLSNPINKLAAASRAFAKGDFSTRVQVRSSNEIGELGHTFNVMASEIEGYIRRLKRAIRENSELFHGTMKALAEAIDAKDPYTRGHSARVNRYSVILARQLGLGESEIRDIHVASMLHDVGKIGIDDSILKKPGALTDEEFEIMKTHTTRGASIMSPIAQMKNMLPGLRWHHERLNGRGYPDALAAEEIPLMARIIAVADTFDAITTNRPYQTAMSFQAALERINELKGDALDPRIVEAFNRAYHAGLIGPPRAQAAPQVEDRPAAEPAGVGAS